MSGYLAIMTPGLPAVIAEAIRFTTRSSYGADGQFEAAVIDTADLTGQHDEATLRGALASLELACRPGGVERATVALAKLRAKTAFRSSDGADQHLIGQAYAEDLAEYPADVIDAGCGRWANGNRWWPAWADLKQECDRLVAKRLAEHRALKAALDRQRRAKPAPALPAPKPLPTQQERLRTSVLLRRQANDPRTAARFEVQLAELENRPVEEWAQIIIAEQLAEQRARAEEFQRLADAEKAKPKPMSENDAYLAAKARESRDRIMGITRDDGVDSGVKKAENA
jgi:hypothetical protein